MTPDSIPVLRTQLNRLARRYDRSFLESDPLKFPHRYPRPLDREAVAFLSSVFAFGSVPSIFRTMERLLAVLGPKPVRALSSWPAAKPPSLAGLKHRWVDENDIHRLLRVLGAIYRKDGSLEALFLRGYHPTDPDLQPALESFARHFRTFPFLVPSPSGGSACKRLNLFLRWVVRRSPPELGLWKNVSPEHLYLPIDTHVARLAHRIGLTKRRIAGWPMVVEATRNLRLLDPKDPVRYDFALARLGILVRCRHRPDAELCPHCELEGLCDFGK